MNRRAKGWIAAAAVVTLLLALLVASFLPPAGAAPRAEAFALEGVNVIEPARKRQRDQRVVVGDGRISALGPSGAPGPSDAETIEDYRGHFVLPGLIDMHTHLPPGTALDLTEYFGLLYLLHGVTTVREAGDLDGTAVDAAIGAYEDGKAMPRITSCGPFVSGPDPRWQNSIVVESPEQATEILGRLRAEGRTCIKVYDDLDSARIRALVAAADAVGIAAVGHVPYGLTFEEAALPDTQHLMGVAPPDSIVAGNHVVHRIIDWRGVDSARIAAVVRFSRERELAHTPTLISTHQLRHFADTEAARDDPTVRLLPRMYRDVTWSQQEGLALYRKLGAADLAVARDALELKQHMVRELHEAGVRLHVGTDTQQPFVVPGASLHQEMGLFEDSGIPAEEVWAYATWRAGESSGIEGLGRLEIGAPADLLVFRKDPTQDLAALASLEAVVVAGRLYERSDLEAALARFQDFYGSWLVDRLSVELTRRVLARAVKRAH
jgi:cytosine/adenosine deaminase-related metal-dependent hydrolase